MSMLLGAKSNRVGLIQVPIKTLYEEDNPSSHFNPILDSMRIYFVLFGFAIVSVLTAIIDYTIFIFAYSQGLGIGRSQIAARLVAMVFNYNAVKRSSSLAKRWGQLYPDFCCWCWRWVCFPAA